MKFLGENVFDDKHGKEKIIKFGNTTIRIKNSNYEEIVKSSKNDSSKNVIVDKNLSSSSKIEDKRENQITIKVNNDKLEFLNFLREKHSFEGFFHYTDFSNFIKIMQSGKLLSRNMLDSIEFIDSANQVVIERTNEMIKDWVRLYYKEKTPTIFRNEGIKYNNSSPHMPIPVIFLFDEKIIYNDRIAFIYGSGGNIIKITKSVDDALKFNWKLIFFRGRIPRSENNIENVFGETSGAVITNIKNSEFLYYKELNLENIKKIIFRSEADLKHAINYFGKNNLFTVDRLKFNNENNYLKDYCIKIDDDGVMISLEFNSVNYLCYSHLLEITYTDNSLEIIILSANNKQVKIHVKYVIQYLDSCIKIKIRTRNNSVTKILTKKIVYKMNNHVSAIWEDNK